MPVGVASVTVGDGPYPKPDLDLLDLFNLHGLPQIVKHSASVVN